MRKQLHSLLLFLLFPAAIFTIETVQAQSSKSISIPDALKEISKAFGTEFFYDKGLLQGKRTSYDLTNLKSKPLEEIMKGVLYPQGFLFVYIKNNYYTIVPKDRIGETSSGSKSEESTSGTISVETQAPSLRAISGIVVTNNSQPVPGASITAELAKNSAITDANGQFRINAKSRDVITVSSVGYNTQEIAVTNQSALRVNLETYQKQLDEVVVIGYGTTTQRKSTGSISSITSEEISKQPVANPLNALQGRIPGAVIYQSNGLPGSRVTIQIRGVNSLGSGQQPLFIIDGVPFNMIDQTVPASNDINSFGLFAANRGISPFSMINPNDIERIDVLKDADATAIYGTKAANGVVLITTKKGKAGKTKLDVNVYRGQGKVSRFIPMMNTQQYLQMRREAFANDGLTPTVANAPDLLVWDTTKYTNWQEKLIGGTANTTDAQATISGGDARTKFLFSTGYHKETTVFPGDFSDDRISIRFNADHSSLDRKFNAVVTASYSFNKSNLLSTDLGTVYNLPPNLPTRNADGTLFWNANFTNPEAYLLQTYTGKTNNLIANTSLRYTILPGLDLKASLSFNSIAINQNQQQPVLSKNPFGTAPTNSALFSNITQQSYTIEPQATYTKKMVIGTLMLLAGGTLQSSLNEGTVINADDYANPILLGTPLGAGRYTRVDAPYTLYKYNSFFGRVNYDWQSKYFLNVNFRRDGSSRFGPGRQFGNFGSVGAAWIFTNEKLFKDKLPFLEFGKLRASYGLTGSDQIQDYQYLSLYTSSSGALAYQGSAILSPSRIANPGVQWETNKKFEVATDLGLLKDRLQLTINYYRNRSGNQLGFIRIASQAGMNAYVGNFEALIQNKGWEFELNSKNISNKDFEWKTSFNITLPSTTLLEASPTYFSYNQMSLGQPLSYVLRYNYRGVDPQTGRPLYRNFTKDSLTFVPVLNVDRSVAGFTAPKFYGGISNSLSYKGVELSFFFQFTKQEGNILPSAAPGILTNGNQTTLWLDRWRRPGDISSLPKATTTSGIYANYAGSDAIWGDASFARLRNAVLSYSLPQIVVTKMKMTSLRVYIQGQNLYTWTKNKYVSDPETVANVNQSAAVMPPLRVITAGVNISF